VGPGLPEPVTEYEMSQLEGGLEQGLVTPVAALNAPTSVTIGFGIYMADWDPATATFIEQDPLNSVDVCRDNWLHLDWSNWVCAAFINNAAGTNMPVPEQYPGAFHSRFYRFSGSPRVIPEGKALMWAISITPNLLLTNFSFNPYYRYHIRKIS